MSAFGSIPRLHALPALGKAGLVMAGYAAALLLACAAVAVNEALMPADTSDGMAAFGDLILFVMVFCFVSIVPTGLAVYFLIGPRKA